MRDRFASSWEWFRRLSSQGEFARIDLLAPFESKKKRVVDERWGERRKESLGENVLFALLFCRFLPLSLSLFTFKLDFGFSLSSFPRSYRNKVDCTIGSSVLNADIQASLSSSPSSSSLSSHEKKARSSMDIVGFKLGKFDGSTPLLVSPLTCRNVRDS